jgi:hypothetical protein
MRIVVCRLFLAAWIACLCGCGGGGLGISGGSIPVGRAITGTALLPNSQPVPDGTVSVVTLPAGQVLSTTSTNSSGTFQTANVPSTSDVIVVVKRPSGTTLKTVVSRSTLAANPGTPLNVGQINATTTLVCDAIEQEAGLLSGDTSNIVSNQVGHLKHEADNRHDDEEEQEHQINDDPYRHGHARDLIQTAANSELDDLASNRTTTNANIALGGLIGSVAVLKNSAITPTSGKQTSLVAAQVAGTTYSNATVAAALRAAGVSNANDSAAQNASQKIRRIYPALGRFGTAITPFEAFLIAALPTSQDGFQLDQAHLDTFFTALSL